MKNQVFKVSNIGIIFLLTLIPIFRIIFLLSSNGINIISDDDFLISPLINQILSGEYSWPNIFYDTFKTGHSWLLMVLIQTASAYFAHWNIFIILYLGVAISILKLLLVFDILTNYIHSYYKFWLLPFLSLLIFAPSSISTFEWDFITLMQGLTHFGLVLGIWGLVRFSNSGFGIALAIFGGLISSFSSGSGPLVWPVFFIGMAFLNKRKKTDYLWVFLGAILGCWQYFYFFWIAKPIYSPEVIPYSKITILNIPFIIKAIGWPFSQDFSNKIAFWRGWVGLCLFLIGVTILFTQKRYKNSIKYAVPSLMLILFSILNMWQISAVRSGLFKWYSYQFMLFWLGLIGLAFFFLNKRTLNPKKINTVKIRKISQYFGKVWAFFLIGIITFFYFTSNLSYADKTQFLKNRSPSTASCLRNYPNAPTYCATALFWKIDNIKEYDQLAKPLLRHNLSVFSPKQRWTLQGDFILDKVKINETKGVPDIFWSADITNKKVPFTSYRHLNLFLHSPNFVDWEISLPDGLKEAVLFSAVAISSSAPKDFRADGLTFKVIVKKKGEPSEIVFSKYIEPDQRAWQPFNVSLKKYSGKTINIRFSTEPGENLMHDWGMYQYPYIDLELPLDYKNSQVKSKYNPSNVFPFNFSEKTKKKNFRFDLKNRELWNIVRMFPLKRMLNNQGIWEVRDDPNLEYIPDLNLCLADYKSFFVGIGASNNNTNATMQIFYKINGQQDFNEENSLLIPFIADGKSRIYTYDLKLLEQNSRAKLTGIRLDPVFNGPLQEQGWVKITDFGLINGDVSSFCSKK